MAALRAQDVGRNVQRRVAGVLALEALVQHRQRVAIDERRHQRLALRRRQPRLQFAHPVRPLNVHRNVALEHRQGAQDHRVHRARAHVVASRGPRRPDDVVVRHGLNRPRHLLVVLEEPARTRRQTVAERRLQQGSDASAGRRGSSPCQLSGRAVEQLQQVDRIVVAEAPQHPERLVPVLRSERPQRLHR